MQTNQQWIWQHPEWPNFNYDSKILLPEITALSRLIGALEITCQTLAGDELLEAKVRVLTEDAIETSAIEGETLKRSSIRASVRKQLGLPVEKHDEDMKTDGLVEMLLDARNNTDQPLNSERLFSWHAAIFPTGYSGLRKIRVGRYRGTEPMQILSGPIGKERIHYIAPPKEILANEMTLLLKWISTTKNTDEPLLKAGIAHLWFIMIHPFDDGNGRIGRAIVDFLIAKDFPFLMQIISFSKHVSIDQKGYYHILEESGKYRLDITNWLVWFLRTIKSGIKQSQWVIEQVIQKAHFWQKHADTVLNSRQLKMINRLLESGDHFEGGMTTRKYAGMCKCSKVTASRDLTDLENKGIVQKMSGRGRSTSYEIRKT